MSIRRGRRIGSEKPEGKPDTARRRENRQRGVGVAFGFRSANVGPNYFFASVAGAAALVARRSSCFFRRFSFFFIRMAAGLPMIVLP